MNISDVRIKVLDTVGNLKAIASITIDGCFVVHDVKLIQGKDALFVAMPGSKNSLGVFRDIAHPLDTATREQILQAVTAAYFAAKPV